MRKAKCVRVTASAPLKSYLTRKVLTRRLCCVRVGCDAGGIKLGADYAGVSMDTFGKYSTAIYDRDVRAKKILDAGRHGVARLIKRRLQKALYGPSLALTKSGKLFTIDGVVGRTEGGTDDPTYHCCDCADGALLPQ